MNTTIGFGLRGGKKYLAPDEFCFFLHHCPNLSDNPHRIPIPSQKLRHVRKETKSSAEVSDYPDSKHKTYHKKTFNCRPPFPPIIKLSQLISMSPGFASKYKEMSVQGKSYSDEFEL